MPPGSTNEVRGASFSFRRVDVALEPLDLACKQAQPFRLALALGHREVGAEVEQIVLDHAEHRIERGVLQMHAHDADRGIGLVDGSIGRDPQIVFRTPLARAERGGAVVAGPRIDAIEHDHVRRLALFLLPLWEKVAHEVATDEGSASADAKDFAKRRQTPHPDRVFRWIRPLPQGRGGPSAQHHPT